MLIVDVVTFFICRRSIFAVFASKPVTYALSEHFEFVGAVLVVIFGLIDLLSTTLRLNFTPFSTSSLNPLSSFEAIVAEDAFKVGPEALIIAMCPLFLDLTAALGSTLLLSVFHYTHYVL